MLVKLPVWGVFMGLAFKLGPDHAGGWRGSEAYDMWRQHGGVKQGRRVHEMTQSPAQDIARRIAEAGRRALAEAEARRQQPATPLPPERGGPKGPEPTRYGDWERKGIVSDF
jgi:hypothetical protein